MKTAKLVTHLFYSCEILSFCQLPLSLYNCLGRFLIFSEISHMALRVIDACSRTCNARIVQEIVRASTLHGINFERNTVALKSLLRIFLCGIIFSLTYLTKESNAKTSLINQFILLLIDCRR